MSDQETMSVDIEVESYIAEMPDWLRPIARVFLGRTGLLYLIGAMALFAVVGFLIAAVVESQTGPEMAKEVLATDVASPETANATVAPGIDAWSIRSGQLLRVQKVDSPAAPTGAMEAEPLFLQLRPGSEEDPLDIVAAEVDLPKPTESGTCVAGCDNFKNGFYSGDN